ncbi:winged helix DNA-binding domain-containing protein [Lentzea terrae]|uniref:winged helix DNA-binding domain-containing protein n=1 Tax=Lentzea terrae TaxID=2200761 RepID=UPI000DD2F1C2|nr:winged helix DNA-binding domain-containing protein [Lentzea terrae]
MTRLSARELNRALLSRQHLLRRCDEQELDVVSGLVGLHAQIPVGPYMALWSRLRRYDPLRLSRLIESRELVRTALMRSTIHLVTPDDCMTLRPLVQQVLDRDLFTNSAHAATVRDLDLDAVVRHGLELLDVQPRTPSELGKAMHERWPDAKPESLAYAVRNLAPLVQIPPRGTWGGAGRTVHASASTWLDRSVDSNPSIERLIRRYLAAFGPASVADVQAWCGLTKLGEVVERMRPELRVYLDSAGKELFDVPEGVVPDSGVAAPPRYLPEFDNVFLSHANRERIIPDGLSFAEWTRKHGLMMTVRGGVLRGNLLIGGLLQGIWRVDKAGKACTLIVEPFVRVSKKDLDVLEREGNALLGFAFPQGEKFDVQVSAHAG